MIHKKNVIKLIEHMPDIFSMDELVDKLVLLQKIELSQMQMDNGDGIDWEDIKKEMDLWLLPM